MVEVALETLKDKVGEYVHRAAAGETIVVTEDGRPVAELNPARQVPDRYKDHPVLARGIREGWIRPAVRGPDWPPQGKPVPGLTLEEILDDLDDARKDPWC
jgi:prevent-host-death family protein